MIEDPRIGISVVSGEACVRFGLTLFTPAQARLLAHTFRLLAPDTDMAEYDAPALDRAATDADAFAGIDC